MATPEENAYTEAFYSIQQTELTHRHSFASFYHARQHTGKYMHWYNRRRKHGAIGFITPMQKWAQGFSRTTVKTLVKQGVADLSRPDSVDMRTESALYSHDKNSEPASLYLTGDRITTNQ